MKETMEKITVILVVILLPCLLLFCASEVANGGGGRPCDPACGTCEKCVNGECRPRGCDPPCENCKHCEGCTCETDCDGSKCQKCINGSCEDECTYESNCLKCNDEGRCIEKCKECEGDCNGVTGNCDPICTEPCTKCVFNPRGGPGCVECDPCDCEECIEEKCEDRCKADPNTCLKCDGNGNCISSCGEGEFCCKGSCCNPDICQVCVDGHCKNKCDPNLCHVCDGNGNCVDRCPVYNFCLECDGEGWCESRCNKDLCQECVNDQCKVCGGRADECCVDGTCVDKCDPDGGACSWNAPPTAATCSPCGIDDPSCCSEVIGLVCRWVIVSEHTNTAKCADCASNCGLIRDSSCVELKPKVCDNSWLPVLGVYCNCKYPEGLVTYEYLGDHYVCP